MLQMVVFVPFVSAITNQREIMGTKEGFFLQEYRFLAVVFNPTCCADIFDITLLTLDLGLIQGGLYYSPLRA